MTWRTHNVCVKYVTNSLPTQQSCSPYWIQANADQERDGPLPANNTLLLDSDGHAIRKCRLAVNEIVIYLPAK